MTRTRSLAGFAVVLATLGLLASAASAQGVRPQSLLVYYGYPSSLNGLFSAPLAAAEFGRYDHVVWGDGLELPSHPDHANALAILADPAMANTAVYGYVDLGVATQNLSLAEIQSRLDQWQAMGVAGVLLDDFGYDYGTTRARQNAAVDHAHAQGLAVIANAWVPADAFGAGVDAVHNPAGEATHLGPADAYLYESHGVMLDQYEDASAWRAKSDALEAYRGTLGFRVFSITTRATDDPNSYDEAKFFYAWYAALLAGHEATGWGEFGFSAYGASNSVAHFRTRPVLDPGTAFAGPIEHQGQVHTRLTDTGRIKLDTTLRTWGFSGLVADVGAGTPVVRALRVSPNPVGARARIAFTLDGAQRVSVAVFDATGRRVATIASGTLSAGLHEPVWEGRDDAGRRVPAGSYFVAVETDSGRRVARMAVVR